MNAREELVRWKKDFANARTEQEKADHKRRFKAYVESLAENERKDFVKEYVAEAHKAADELKTLSLALSELGDAMKKASAAIL